MPPRARIAAAAAALVLLAIGALASGCGGQTPPRPRGFSRYSEAGLQLDYPSGWTVDHRGPGAGQGIRLAAHGPPGPDGFARLDLSRQKRLFDDAAELGGLIAERRPFELFDGRHVSDGPAEVAGADDGWRIVTAFRDRAHGGRRVPAESIELVAVQGLWQFQLSLIAPSDVLRRTPVNAIMRSLRVG